MLRECCGEKKVCRKVTRVRAYAVCLYMYYNAVDIILIVGQYFVTPATFGRYATPGFEVWKQGVTHATKVATIGYGGDEGLKRAKAEIEKRLTQTAPKR